MRIKIGDDILDSYKNEIIAQNYAVNEIGNITNRQGGFSNEFLVPFTSKNRSILDFPADVNSLSRKPYQKVSASLIDQGATVATGYLRYQIVEDNEIRVSFFSDNVEWFSLLKDKSIKDLDLSEFDHDWTLINIVAAINADKSSGYTYPLIDYGEFADLTTLTVSSGQLYPAVFVSTIVNRIFFEIGWKEDGEMIDHPLYKRMIIPFSDKTFSHPEDYTTNNSTSFSKDVDQLAGALGTNPALLTWVGGITDLSPTVDNVYTIVTQLNIGPADIIFPPTTYSVSIKINGVLISEITGQTIYGEIIQITIEDIPVLTTDDLTVEVLCDTESMTILAANSRVDFNITPSIKPGTEIQISNILPDIKQSDFLKYLAFVFGAVPQANNFSKTVNFGLFKSIKNNISDALDWSSKLDLSKSKPIDFTELLTNYKSTSILRYADDDNDEELKQYLAETTRTFGDGQLDIDNEHIAGEETIYEAPFSPMININSFDNTMYIPQIRFKVDGEGDLEPEPKIAILSENFPAETVSLDLYNFLRIINSEDNYSFSDVANIPFCWFAKTELTADIDALLDSLPFDQIAFTNAVGDPVKDRFLKDYEEILNGVKYIKAFFHLNESDINELDFLIPIFIDHYKAYFYISKINNYQGSFKTTEAELVKIADG